MSQKRQQDDGKAHRSDADDKRPRRTTFQNVVSEIMKLHSVQHLLEPILEPLIRRVIREEVELALRKHLSDVKQNCEKETQPSESRILKLQFVNNLSLPVFTGARIEGEESSSGIKVALVDCSTGKIVESGPEASAKVEIVVLEGDFDGEEGDNWTPEEFKNNIVREREGKKPLLTGEPTINLNDGVVSVSDMSFTDNSSWTRSRRFRLGARVVDNFDGTRIREAKTESFIVRDHRGELYKKHHPPSLLDEVWRLEKIGKEGAFHKRLTRENIRTVKDFLTLLFVNPPQLRQILGTGMSTKMWEVTVEHAQTCVLDKRIYLYCSPGSQQGPGVVFNLVGQVLYLLLECEYIPVSKLSETQKADAQNLVLSAFAHWGEVVSFDDEASLLGGGSSNVANVCETSSSPRGEDYDGSNLLASKEINRFDYMQPPTDIISSFYSVGSTIGLDDYDLHNIDGMNLRYDQALSFPDSISHAFCNDDHLQFFDTDLHSPTIPPQSPADLQSAVDGFLSAQRSTAAVAAVDKAMDKIIMHPQVVLNPEEREKPGPRHSKILEYECCTQIPDSFQNCLR